MANHLSEKQLMEFREAFSMFDLDNNGTISTSELGLLMKSLGNNLTEADLISLMREVDLDCSGSIDVDEFVNMMIKQPDISKYESELRETFKAFDIESKGFITAVELREVMKLLGENITQEEAKEIVQEADRDGDGKIDYQDFVKMMCHQ